jgi:hypothetical protein
MVGKGFDGDMTFCPPYSTTDLGFCNYDERGGGRVGVANAQYLEWMGRGGRGVRITVSRNVAKASKFSSRVVFSLFSTFITIASCHSQDL